MHKPVPEKSPEKTATAETCVCACGESKTACPKHDPPPVNVATNLQVRESG